MPTFLIAPSGRPGDLPGVFSLAKYRGSAWWTIYFLFDSKLGSKESSAIGDSGNDSTEGSSQGELW